MGQTITLADSFGSPRLFHFPAERFTASSATGVCHKPDAVPLMGRSKVGCRKTSPLRVIPQRGKVTDDHGKASSHKQR
nr:hypothetical protein [Chromobacterium subtsugae]